MAAWHSGNVAGLTNENEIALHRAPLIIISTKVCDLLLTDQHLGICN